MQKQILLNDKGRFDITPNGTKQFRLKQIDIAAKQYLFAISVANTFAADVQRNNNATEAKVQFVIKTGDALDLPMATGDKITLGKQTRTTISDNLTIVENLHGRSLTLELKNDGPLFWCNGREEVQVEVQLYALG